VTLIRGLRPFFREHPSAVATWTAIGCGWPARAARWSTARPTTTDPASRVRRGAGARRAVQL